MDFDFTVDPDITVAETLPAQVYTSPEAFARICDRALTRTWHLLFPQSYPKEWTIQPLTLFPDSLAEAIVLTREAGRIRALSNVCTHRGMLVATETSQAGALRCGYHGRCFALTGCFKSMPEFEDAKNFPRADEGLEELALKTWHDTLWTSLDPASSIEPVLAYVDSMIDFLPLESGHFDTRADQTYEVAANWLLYCDNYLEGFHIPYVHPSLNQALDYKNYYTELFEGGTLQVGIGSNQSECFQLPKGHPKEGELIAAFYFYLFPTTMINVYPWGISWNTIEPRTVSSTRVHYRAYVWDEAKRQSGAGQSLDSVEMEDEAVVEATHRGLRSRFYRRGRYSPSRERGLHHIHCHLMSLLSADRAS